MPIGSWQIEQLETDVSHVPGQPAIMQWVKMAQNENPGVVFADRAGQTLRPTNMRLHRIVRAAACK